MTLMKPPRAQKYRRNISISDQEEMSCSWPQLHTSTMGKGQIKQKTTILGYNITQGEQFNDQSPSQYPVLVP